MDNASSSYCSSPKIIYSAGHLAGVMNYGSGRFEIQLKGPHQYDGSLPLNNTMACFGLYCGTSTCAAHNEISICFHPNDPTNVHYSYWVGTDGD
jgi:hypothetical protein